VGNREAEAEEASSRELMGNSDLINGMSFDQKKMLRITLILAQQNQKILADELQQLSF